MAARKNPETKTLVLGAGLAVAAGLAFYWWQGRGEGPTEAAPSSNDPVSLVREALRAKGHDVTTLQFRAQPKGADIVVQVRDPAQGKTMTFGVRNGKVKPMNGASKGVTSTKEAQKLVSSFLKDQGEDPKNFTFKTRQKGDVVEIQATSTEVKLVFGVKGGKVQLQEVIEVDGGGNIAQRRQLDAAVLLPETAKPVVTRSSVIAASGLPKGLF